jgi:transcription antitermination factor NusG
MSENWYALHVKPRFEKYVTTQLEGKGYETFLPTYVSTRKWSDRVKSLDFPLFPGYVFCLFDLHARLPIVITPGVMSVLGAGKSPTPIDENELSAVRHVTDLKARVQPHPYLAAGETVQVDDGPLAGLTGIILRTKGSDLLVVSVSLLMRSVSVEIDRRYVKPIRRWTEKAPVAHTNVPDGASLELASAVHGRW